MPRNNDTNDDTNDDINDNTNQRLIKKKKKRSRFFFSLQANKARITHSKHSKRGRFTEAATTWLKHYAPRTTTPPHAGNQQENHRLNRDTGKETESPNQDTQPWKPHTSQVFDYSPNKRTDTS
eukprot:TRINITY_DN1956_c0_g1_i3.p1 TRINITY_DN1956_c0_g1~~TRINITY_DN1956_c0_g1_i3.p1  ORF type:complete len:123 (-),score=10.43 TRINITY_DN1956_c0_g1_i3:708-1076(-)